MEEWGVYNCLKQRSWKRELLPGSRWIAIHICTVTQPGKQMLAAAAECLLVKTCGRGGFH
jgi:hypothetical protein